MITIKSFRNAIFGAMVIILGTVCHKTDAALSVLKPASFTVVNVIPNSEPIIPVFNTSSSIEYFRNSLALWYPGNGYASYKEYSPPGGEDTVYVVQQDDTLNIGPKATGMMYYGVLNLNPGNIYSLFLTGVDTSSPDYLITTDSLPYHNTTDSTVGIRFVNLSTGFGPMSVNLEGGSNGSEVVSLSYKAITEFKSYLCNSTMTNSNYLFVIRDVATGDSLTSFTLSGVGSGNGIGLGDPYNGNAPLIYKNVTIVIYGSGNPSSNTPLNTTLIDNY